MWTQLVSVIRHTFCRHVFMLHFEGKRMCLQCTECGYVTPGWLTGKADNKGGQDAGMV